MHSVITNELLSNVAIML